MDNVKRNSNNNYIRYFLFQLENYIKEMLKKSLQFDIGRQRCLALEINFNSVQVTSSLRIEIQIK